MNMSVLPGRVLSHTAWPCRSSVKAQVASYRPLPVAAKPKLTHNHTSAFSISEPNGGLPEERQAAIAETLQRCMDMLAERTAKFVGYPINLDYDYSALNGLFSYSINNVGDPFIQATYGMHTREFEVGVLDWFARLWDIDQNEYWGYVTNGGTEGNLHGILVGRENLPDGILYASKEAHYSVFKAARMYRMDSIKVQTLSTGEIDYQDFAAHLRANMARPAIVNVNIGTTMKGAVDDLDRILEILQATGYGQDRFYIHCDGALLGVMMPFIQAAPMMTFKKPIGSVSVSGHKFVGTPMPCGVVLARKRYVKALSNDEVEYINNKDATITGSRNGHAPVFLWYALQCKGYEGMRRDAEYCMRTAMYLKHMLDSAGIATMLNDVSNMVVFERPLDDALVRKWQLACEGDIAHVVVMPHVTIDQLDEFVADYINSRARLAAAAAGPLLGWAGNRE